MKQLRNDDVEKLILYSESLHDDKQEEKFTHWDMWTAKLLQDRGLEAPDFKFAATFEKSELRKAPSIFLSMEISYRIFLDWNSPDSKIRMIKSVEQCEISLF